MVPLGQRQRPGEIRTKPVELAEFAACRHPRREGSRQGAIVALGCAQLDQLIVDCSPAEEPIGAGQRQRCEKEHIDEFTRGRGPTSRSDGGVDRILDALGSARVDLLGLDRQVHRRRDDRTTVELLANRTPESDRVGVDLSDGSPAPHRSVVGPEQRPRRVLCITSFERRRRRRRQGLPRLGRPTEHPEGLGLHHLLRFAFFGGDQRVEYLQFRSDRQPLERILV